MNHNLQVRKENHNSSLHHLHSCNANIAKTIFSAVALKQSSSSIDGDNNIGLTENNINSSRKLEEEEADG